MNRNRCYILCLLITIVSFCIVVATWQADTDIVKIIARAGRFFSFRAAYVKQCGNVEAATAHASSRSSYEFRRYTRKNLTRIHYFVLYRFPASPRSAGKRKIVAPLRVLYLIWQPIGLLWPRCIEIRITFQYTFSPPTSPLFRWHPLLSRSFPCYIVSNLTKLEFTS